MSHRRSAAAAATVTHPASRPEADANKWDTQRWQIEAIHRSRHVLGDSSLQSLQLGSHLVFTPGLHQSGEFFIFKLIVSDYV